MHGGSVACHADRVKIVPERQEEGEEKGEELISASLRLIPLPFTKYTIVYILQSCKWLTHLHA